MTWKCTHCDEIYQDDEQCTGYFEEVAAENKRLRDALEEIRAAGEYDNCELGWASGVAEKALQG